MDKRTLPHAYGHGLLLGRCVPPVIGYTTMVEVIPVHSKCLPCLFSTGCYNLTQKAKI